MSKLRMVSFKFLDLLVIFMMVFGPPMSGFVTPAHAAPVMVIDDAGADDEPGQKDLNFLTIDYTPSTPDIAVTWGWDDTMWSGNNTGDACTLFDTNGNGFANYSLCITVDQAGAYLATRLYSCDADSRSDRCGGPTLVPTLQSTGSASIQSVDPFGPTGRTNSDCSSTVKGTCLTQDTVAALTVKLSDFGGATAKLINVCSYPSQEPNSDPSDCVITPNAGFLTIVKDAGTDTTTDFVFNASEMSAGDKNTWKITGSGSVQLISYNPTTALDLTEVIPSGWQLDSVACLIQTATPTATGTATSTGVDNLEIRSGLETICTFTDSLSQGTLIVEKNLVNDNLGSKACTDFSFKVDGGSAVAFESDCSNSITVLAGSHTVVEVGVPIDGYATTYSNCTNVSVPAGGTATCTITNDDIAVPKINVTKSSTTSSITAAAQVIPYTFVVTNTGNQTLTGITVSDPNCDSSPAYVSGDSNTDSKLQVTETWTYTCNHTVTQAEIDSNGGGDGDLDNTVTADSNESEPDTADYFIPINQTAKLSIVKTGAWVDGDMDGFADVGEVINYTFAVKNEGNVTLTNVTVTDPKVTVVGGPTTLDVGETDTTTFTGSYTLTQADIDAGKVDNTATADSNESGPASDDETVSLPQNAKLSIIKTGAWVDGDMDGFADVGEIINYTFAVKNEGNVTLHNVTVTDTVGGVTIFGGPTTLDVGETDTTTFTGVYYITQADINAGHFFNSATTDSDESGPASDDEDVTLPQNAAIDLIKTGTFDAGANGYADPGELISYEFLVTNTGNVTLTGITVTDPKVSPISCPFTTLAVGTSMTCTGSYAVTQADIDAGSVYNLATADSKESGPDNDDETVSLPQNAKLSIIKTGAWVDGDMDGFADAGEVINYTFAVKNEGNVTLTNVTVTDPKVTVVGGPTTLDVGETDTTTFTGTYTLTQVDIDAGKVDNTATADSSESGPASDDETVSLPQNAALELTKTGSFDAGLDGFADPGELITYTFKVCNIGNVTLTNVTVTDPKVTVVGGPTTLDVGECDSTTFTGSYAVKQADVDAGSVYNLALADSKESEPDTDDETVTLPQNAKLSIVKTGAWVDGDADGFADVGEVINYAFAVKNEGNVTLHNVMVADTVGGVTIAGGPTTLDVGETDTTTFTGTYTLTQGDIDAGHFFNTATADSNESGPSSDDEDVSLPQNPAIEVLKSGTFMDENGDGYANVGETISYTFTVKNIGNVTLYNVTITDPKVTVKGGPLASLAVGATDTTTFTATYTLTQADIDAGSVANTATACGYDTQNDQACDTGDNNEPLPQNPAIQLTKSATLQLGNNGTLEAGDTVLYGFVIQNIGNVTLTGVDLDDSLLGYTDVTCGATTLAPGESTNCAATYTLTQADLDAGSVANTGNACGTPPVGADACDTDTTTTPLAQRPVISIVKSLLKYDDNDTSGDISNGDGLWYQFLVTNDGNVTLNTVSVTDNTFGIAVTCPVTVLAPTQSTTCTAQAAHIVTLLEANAGEVFNEATASGTDPGKDVVTDTDNLTTPVVQHPAISIVKSLATYDDNDASGDISNGDGLWYQFLVTNTGDVTLDPVSVTDDTFSIAVTCPDTALDPGDFTTCTADAAHTVTLAEANASKVFNEATASGTDPSKDVVTATDDLTTPVVQHPAISLDKTVTSTGPYNTVGQSITYSLVATNTGDITLHNVSISDPKLGTLTCTQPVDLAPGAKLTCTATHAITQADLDAGSYYNIATADSDETDKVTDDVTVPMTQNPAITLTKTASPTLYSKAGDIISYSLVAKNTGNVTLHDVTITDPKLGTLTCNPVQPSTLAPNASMTCTGSYTIQAADLTVFSVTNTATVTGKDPKDNTISTTATATVYRQTGALLPTQTTCQQYASGQWPAMYSAFTYQVKSNKINSVAPGVIFYYNTITAPSASFTLTVVETNSLNWRPMFIQDLGQAILYDANCNKASGVAVTAGGSPYTVTFTVTGATPGAIYYIGIKYSPQNLVGQAVKQPYPTNTYVWTSKFNGVSLTGSTASIQVKYKK